MIEECDISQVARRAWFKMYADERQWSERTRQQKQRYEICERCEGRGNVGNPAFDGMSTQAVYEELGPDEAEEFFTEYTTPGGMYSVSCPAECENGKILVPDFSKFQGRDGGVMMGWELEGIEEIFKEMRSWEEEMYDMRQQEKMERMMEGSWEY